MKNFEEYTKTILEKIREKADGAFCVRITTAIKNNGIKLTGILAAENGSENGPCIYLNDFYEDYENKRIGVEEAAEEIYRLLAAYLKSVDRCVIAIAGLQKWEAARGAVHAKLINAEQNRKLLGKIPHRMFLDMAVVYYMTAEVFKEQDIGTILIYNEHMEMWGQNEEELYQNAMYNMRSDGGPDFKSIEAVIKDIFPNQADCEDGRTHRSDAGMYILTNCRKCFGASELLDQNTLQDIADKIGDGFIILPSSLHEVIVLPFQDEAEYKTLAEMVKEVNDTQVSVEERLSYHVYAYSRSERTLKIVA